MLLLTHVMDLILFALSQLIFFLLLFLLNCRFHRRPTIKPLHPPVVIELPNGKTIKFWSLSYDLRFRSPSPSELRPLLEKIKGFHARSCDLMLLMKVKQVKVVANNVFVMMARPGAKYESIHASDIGVMYDPHCTPSWQAVMLNKKDETSEIPYLNPRGGICSVLFVSEFLPEKEIERILRG